MDFHYQCTECNREYDNSTVRYTCQVCSQGQQPINTIRGVVRVILPYHKLNQTFSKNQFAVNRLLPIEPAYLPGYPVGNTPLIRPPLLVRELGFSHLFFKDEAANPTGSLKDRASFLIAAQALKVGATSVVVASTGNAASAMAGIGAWCGLPVIIFVPHTAPRAKLAQSLIFGAQVFRLKATYDDAFDISLKYTQKHGGLNRNTAYNPFTIEGKKTAAFEIYQQLGHRAPDVIFIPTGDGVILSGIFKGFFDLQQLDLIEKIPQLVVCQAEGSDVIVKGLMTGTIEPRQDAHTIADSISVKVPRNGLLALKDVKASNGFGITVSDNEILNAQSILGRTAGLFVEPAAACAFAGFLKVREGLDPEKTVVVLLTGNGLKDVRSALKSVKLPTAIDLAEALK